MPSGNGVTSFAVRVRKVALATDHLGHPDRIAAASVVVAGTGGA